MDCAAKGSVETPCDGPATRRCGLCGAVAYCSVSHQISHWSDHKGECARLEKQMQRANLLHDFPFTFSVDTTLQVARCSFLMARGLHQIGLWKNECGCGPSFVSSNRPSDVLGRIDDGWNLPSALCPCTEPVNQTPTHLNDWRDYYEWRCLPLHSPVSLLLHWPLTIYQGIQLACSKSSNFKISDKLRIHYLGPNKELMQLAVFGELRALFPGFQVHIDLIGPEVPQFRDGERVSLCSYACCIDVDCACNSLGEVSWKESNGSSVVTLQLWKGLYHHRCQEIMKDSLPHLVVALNAGIAAYSTWLPTIVVAYLMDGVELTICPLKNSWGKLELIQKMGVPAIFSDYCEEAAHLAAHCISSVTRQPLTIPVLLNPFRKPMAVEDSTLFIPCYSNCFLFGI